MGATVHVKAVLRAGDDVFVDAALSGGRRRRCPPLPVYHAPLSRVLLT